MAKLKTLLQDHARSLLAIALALGGLLALGASRRLDKFSQWESDFLLNIGSSLLFAALGLALIDWIVRQHDKRVAEAARRVEEQQWEPVREHIDNYVLNVARRCALAYRIGVGIGDDDLPRATLMREGIGGLRGTRAWIEDAIIPALPNLSRRNPDGWKQLFEMTCPRCLVHLF